MTDEIPQNHYVYWVAYHFGGASRNGFGGRHVWSPSPGDSFVWVESVATWIQEQNPSLGTVLILNWQRLEGDERWENATQ